MPLAVAQLLCKEIPLLRVRARARPPLGSTCELSKRGCEAPSNWKCQKTRLAWKHGNRCFVFICLISINCAVLSFFVRKRFRSKRKMIYLLCICCVSNYPIEKAKAIPIELDPLVVANRWLAPRSIEKCPAFANGIAFRMRTDQNTDPKHIQIANPHRCTFGAPKIFPLRRARRATTAFRLRTSPLPAKTGGG